LSATVHEFLKAGQARGERRGSGGAQVPPEASVWSIQDAETILRVGASHIGDPTDPAGVYRWFACCAAAHLSDLMGPRLAAEYLTRLAAVASTRAPTGGPEAA
jgi:hypothetical protein